SDKAQVELQRQNNCKIKLVVKASEALANEARKDAIKQIAKEVSIPGFRKGKAPAAIIEKKYPKAVIEQWEKSFADLSFKEAQRLAKVPLLNGNSRISFHLESLKKEGGEASFQFETEPNVPDVDPSKLNLKEIEEVKIDD